MTKKTIPMRAFDYSALSPKLQALLQNAKGEILEAKASISRSIVRIGALLLDCQRELGSAAGRVGGKNVSSPFWAWARAELSFGQGTAKKYMQSARRWKESDSLENVCAKGLQNLSQRNVPDAALEEAKARAAGGEKISHATAQTIIARHRHREDGARPGPSPQSAGQARYYVRQALAQWSDDGQRAEVARELVAEVRDVFEEFGLGHVFDAAALDLATIDAGVDAPRRRRPAPLSGAGLSESIGVAV